MSQFEDEWADYILPGALVVGGLQYGDNGTHEWRAYHEIPYAWSENPTGLRDPWADPEQRSARGY